MNRNQERADRPDPNEERPLRRPQRNHRRGRVALADPDDQQVHRNDERQAHPAHDVDEVPRRMDSRAEQGLPGQNRTGHDAHHNER